MLPPKVLKNRVSKVAISSILRQILYWFNTIFFARKLHFCKNKKSKRGARAPTAVQKELNGDTRFQFPSANITSRLTRSLTRGDSLCERVQFFAVVTQVI